MKLQGRNLSNGTRGDDVRLLHHELRLLGFRLIPDSETHPGIFGPHTLVAVREFQEKAGLEVTGIVDEATAKAINERVDEPGDGSDGGGVGDGPLRVSGRITDSGGRPVIRVIVRAFDRELRSETLLGETKAGSGGRYEIKYSREAFKRREKRAADVFIEVRDLAGDGKARSPITFNAPDALTIDLVLDDNFFSEAEFTRLLREVQGGVAEDKIAIADLDDTQEHPDIQFLTAEFDVPAERILYLILAHRIERRAGIEAAFFYALLRRNVLLSFSTSRLHAIRFVVPLDSNPQVLLEEIALLPESTITAAVDSAISLRIVEPGLRDALPAILLRLAALRAAAEQADAVRSRDALVDLFGRALDGGALQGVSEVLAHDHLGHLPLLVEKLQAAVALRSAEVSEDTRAALDLARTFGSTDPLLDRVKTHLRVESETGHGLAALGREDWERTLKAAAQAGALDQTPPSEEAITVQARRLADDFAQRHPTAAFALRLGKEGAARLPEAEELARLVTDHSDLDLATVNVERFFRERKIAEDAPAGRRESLKSALKAAQRLFRLSPSDTQASVLMAEGLTSAQAVSALSRDEFVTRVAAKPGLTEPEAQRIHARASRIHAGAVLLAGELKALAGSLDAKALSPAIPAAKLAQWKADFPNLKALFDLQDMCECLDCRSVYGPGAYLADVLQFLKGRKVKDMTAPPAPASKVAKEALFSRRPDLGDIDLDCENALTEIPYIDVVNELLEDLVAPDPGFAFAGPVAAGSAPASLVQAIVNAKLPLGPKPVVSGPDLAGAFVLRGPEGVCKLAPGGAGGFTVRPTRQTHGSAAERAAAPEYVNLTAYQLLATKRIAFDLPFDAAQREASALFERFDVRRADLMRALAEGGVPSDLAIAAEEIGISKRVADIIVTADSTSATQDELWNTGPGLAVSTFKTVSTFLDRTGLSYAELEELLRQPFVNPTDALFVKHLDSSCDTAQKEIAGLDLGALDRIHRFLRLWRATGFAMADLNHAIRHDPALAGALDPASFVRIGQAVRLARRTGQPAAEILRLYGPGRDGWDLGLYRRIFANPANGAAAVELDHALVAANEAEVPAARVKLAAKIGPLALSLARSPAEIDALRMLLPDDDLTFVRLGALYGWSTVARLARLSVASFLALKRLSGVDPVAGPAATWEFLDAAQTCSTASVDPLLVERLLTVSLTDPDPRIPADAGVKLILEKLQATLAAAFAATRPAFDATLEPAENSPATLDQLARLGDLDPATIAQVELLTRGRWTDPSETPTDFLDRALGGVFPAAAVATIQAAWAAIPGGDPDSRIAERKAFIAALGVAASDLLYDRERRTAAASAISSGLKLSEGLVRLLLDGAYLKAVPAVAAKPLGDVLTDAALITPDVAGHLPAVTSAAFPNAYAAVKLLGVIGIAVALFRLEQRHVAWLLENAAAGGSIELDRLPYQAGPTTITFASVMRWIGVRHLDDTYPPADDPRSPGSLLSVLDVMAAALKAGANATDFLPSLAIVTGWDLAALEAADTHFAFSATDIKLYTDPATLARIETAMTVLKQVGVNLADGLLLAQGVLAPADVAVARSALRVRYEPSDWLTVQKSIENKLREQRRDALVAYLVATDTRFGSALDLFDYLLVNVQMSACQPTSRIVQAHGTVQLFVERCLMGIEPATVADTAGDTGWARWEWMRNYRVWEANRRVFLYPENWIEPELRDDKSPFFRDLEKDLMQTELTDRSAEDATQGYLEKLDEVAFLEHLACYYDTLTGTLHVFARTKGGDPAAYYYRRFIKEREWTAWEKVDLDITADHLVAFMRNRRLYLAWPLFEEEPEPAPPGGVPVPKAGGGTSPPLNKRWKIKIALSEYSGGKWLPKKLAKEGLVSGDYRPETPRPEIYRFLAADLGSAGFYIVVTISVEIPNPFFATASAADFYLGSFAITGCKGYPEPASLNSSQLAFQFSPWFKDTKYRANRPAERGLDSANDFALRELPALAWEQQIFRNTPDGNAGVPGDGVSGALSATFKVAFPQQMTALDKLLALLALLLSRANGAQNAVMKRYGLPIPLASLLPFFFEDRNRVYSLVPGWFLKEENDLDGNADGLAQTSSDLLPVFDDIFERLVFHWQETAKNAKGHPAVFLMALFDDDEFVKAVQRVFSLLFWRFGYRVDNAFHPLACFLRQTLNEKGIPGLLTREVQLNATGFDFSAPSAYAPTSLVVDPYPVEDIDFRRQGAYAGYNWELFFHLPFLVAVKLMKNQRFEEAARWFHYIFDPTGSQGGDAPQKYWITAPFFLRLAPDYAAQRIESILYAVAGDPGGLTLGTLADAIEDWRDRPFQPHVIARSRSVAFQKAVLIKYIENLIAWGDYYFRQETMESVTRADQLYVLAEKLLGPKPRLVPPAVEVRPASFNELEPRLDLFSNALLELESLVPDLGSLPHQGTELPPLPSSLTSLYFCIPPNDKMLDYWGKVADRRFKIAHCRTIDGAERTLALFAPRIDPADLVRAAAQGIPISAVLAGLGAPISPYRFQVTAQKAVELIQELRTLGQELLQALEKRDAEDLALLRSRLEIELLDRITAIKADQIREATEQRKAVERSKDVVSTRLAYYRSRTPMSDLELAALVLQGLSGVAQGVSGMLSAAAGVVNLLPNVTIGIAGFGGSPEVTVTWGSSNVAGGLSSFAGAAGSLAGVLGTAGGIVATVAGYERRKEEWKFQGDLADKEIAQLVQQIVVSKLREDITTKELANHKTQIEHARRTEAFMRSKFTNRDLFDWMAGEISAIYFQAYDLAFVMAKKAERCFQHELGTTDTFIEAGSWDSLRKGLGSANRLMQQVRRMEVAYLDRNRRDYELVKNVSLAMLDPMALLKLRTEGKCTVTIPEALFDLDHTGHYMRRLKAVSVTVPCVVGPYTSLACRLTLLSNRYRRSPVAANAAAYPENPGQDDRFVYNVGGIQSVATSQSQNDTGMFELNFKDERYLPFEGCGAVGTWQIEFGSPFHIFDRMTITDLILHLRYTAREGGSGLKSAAEGAIVGLINQIQNEIKRSGLLRSIDLRHEAPEAWYRLTQTQSAQFTISTEMLPYFASVRTPSLTDAWLLVKARGTLTSLSLSLEGTPITATKDVLAKGLFSTALPSPLAIALDTAFTLASASAGDLEEGYLIVRYGIT